MFFALARRTWRGRRIRQRPCNIIRQPYTISSAQARELDEIVKEFPEGGLSKAGIRVLKADQAQWVRKGRDTQAKILKEGGSTALEAYTAATRLRADELPGIARRIFLQDRPDGPQGYYVRRENGRETGWLSVRWTDKKAGEVSVDAEAILVLRPDNVRSGLWSGGGAVQKGVLKAPDEEGEGSATFTFKGDRVQVATTSDFASGSMGMGVTIEGTYVRQGLPKL